MKNVSLFTLIEIALKHIFVIIASALLVATIAFCYCEFVAVPRYSATGSLVVTNGGILSGEDDLQYNNLNPDSNLDNSDIQASLSFLNTITEILKKPDIYVKMSDKLNGRYSYGQLRGSASIARNNTNNLLIDVTFTAATREEAIELTNAYLSVVPEYIGTQFSQTNITNTYSADSAGKVYPRTLVTTALFGVIGAVIAYAILFLIYCANTVIKGEDDFKDRFNLPVLGCIPDFATAKSEKYYKKYSYSKGGKKKYGKQN